MQFSILTQALCGATLVVGLPGLLQNIEKGVEGALAPLLSPGNMTGEGHILVPFEDAVKKFANAPKATSDPATYNDTVSSEQPLADSLFTTQSTTETAASTCASNPNVRFEWDDYSTSDRQALMAAFKCLMNKPSAGGFAGSKSRWEDFASLHQLYTPNVHQNQKFLPWHRYFTWTFEQVLRDECGFDRAFFWFDETKHAGAFSASDVFSANYLGSLGGTSHCVTDGAFAGLTVNIGPGTSDTAHCLSREGNAGDTAQCSTAYINECMSNADYKDFETCLEYGPHAYGHNGVGGVMADLYSSPAEPFFWFHHTFVDRAWRIWELADPNNRYASIDGTDINGNALSLNTVIYMGGIRPDVTIGEIIDTLSGTTLCYRYNY
ncbi:hypothetical protein F5Y19DRAFT_143707 [Xylariaceae sp. FL1651]|nr:hypothetical protein F5Y19DRAFT_143707 [Xylariaceae sp. FL1651]